MVTCLHIPETLSLDQQESIGRLESREHTRPPGPCAHSDSCPNDPRDPGVSRCQPLVQDSAVTGRTPAEPQKPAVRFSAAWLLRGPFNYNVGTCGPVTGPGKYRRFLQKKDGGLCSGRHLDVVLAGLALLQLGERWTLEVLIPSLTFRLSLDG